jgi:hypothetical protein
MDINSVIITHQNTILTMLKKQEIRFNPTIYSELCNLQIRINQLKNKRDRIEEKIHAKGLYY